MLIVLLEKILKQNNPRYPRIRMTSKVDSEKSEGNALLTKKLFEKL